MLELTVLEQPQFYISIITEVATNVLNKMSKGTIDLIKLDYIFICNTSID